MWGLSVGARGSQRDYPISRIPTDHPFRLFAILGKPSSPELEYAGENEVAVPVPPPSISPCRVDRGELIPVESVDVNGLTDLTLLSVQRAAEAVRLVAQLTERVEGWSVQRTLDQTMVDSARNRLRAEVQLAVAHRLEEARVVEMVDEEVDENASEGTEEEVASAEEYWQTRS
ncbi:hypothetical protein BJ322DRAFT_1022419 [Thelephora terrestris]|uniref:Uncharacterized protein n=1 Tax=Thelephora terrestris TaxID=56493 RepID=A0A9P6HAI8_9AGAM|nr:hypothetical protein BJ322DRAFT_1022419 [Thelephora terrestris]